MDRFEVIENELKKLRVISSKDTAIDLLNLIDSLFNSLYKEVEVEKFTVFLVSVIKDYLEPIEIKFLNSTGSRSTNSKKMNTIGELIRNSRLKLINKYSPYLIKSKLFEKELNDNLFFSLGFKDILELIDGLNEIYSFSFIEKKIKKLRAYSKNLDLKFDFVPASIQLYTELLSVIETNLINEKFLNSKFSKLKRVYESCEEENVYEQLIECENYISTVVLKIKLLKSLERLLKKINPFVIDQYDRKFLDETIKDYLKIKFEDYTDVTETVILDEEVEYKLNLIQHHKLTDLEEVLHSKGFIERYQNKILWIKPKAILNRMCDYFINNIKQFECEDYNVLLRILYKRYNIKDKLNRNDLRNSKYESIQYLDDFKRVFE